MEFITARELLDQLRAIAAQGHGQAPPPTVNRALHEVLRLTCHAALKDSHQAFGNLFSQVDYLCKRARLTPGEAFAAQRARRHANHATPLTREELATDLQSLSVFITKTLHGGTPLPASAPPAPRSSVSHSLPSSLRCIVSRWDGQRLFVTIDADQAGQVPVEVAWNTPRHDYLKPILREGMQLNVEPKRWNGGCIEPRLIVTEPDYLVDISAVAACFADFGHHPLLHTVRRMEPRALSQAILLGNFAGAVLDDLISCDRLADYDYRETMRRFLSDNALETAACPQFDLLLFETEARRQADNLRQLVPLIRGQHASALLTEPSFVCEQLGLQGRVDLMTADMRLLVEQKSGRNRHVERQVPNPYGSFHIESHYVQLLLYYGVLLRNFRLDSRQTTIQLLYSRYPAAQGLLSVAYYDGLFMEAMRLRNQLAATDLWVARNGFDALLPVLTPQTLNTRQLRGGHYTFAEDCHHAVLDPIHRLNPLEKAYFCRMMTFVLCEQRVSKMGNSDAHSFGAADMWNMPLSEKVETGNILTGYPIAKATETDPDDAAFTLRLTAPDRPGEPCDDSAATSFRPGDMVYVYPYPANEVPDARQSVLTKGYVRQLTADSVTLECRQPHVLSSVGGASPLLYAVEKASSDINANAAISQLHRLITAPESRRRLLLGERPPQSDPLMGLTRSYHPHYDDVLLKAKQARDYFLLQGPPGTGKTSMALRFLVQEELASASQAQVLLMSYTNRAVDEICEMLSSARLPFLRVGNRLSCDPRFRAFLISENAEADLQGVPIVVGTTSAVAARDYLFRVKRFSLAIIDEASQILEPQIVGLLAAHTDGKTPRIDRFILVGDHKQLPAVVQQGAADSRVAHPLLRQMGLEDCRESLFERLLRTERRCHRTAFTGVLRRQGRMHPDIAAFPNRWFYAEERLTTVPLPHQEESTLGYLAPPENRLDRLLAAHRLLFLNVEARQQLGKSNPEEAFLVAQVLQRVYRFTAPAFDSRKTVGVIVPYRNQIAAIRREIERLGIVPLRSITIDTVERFQGSQRDVIVYSFTVSQPHQLDFLTSSRMEPSPEAAPQASREAAREVSLPVDRKLNVAITRARKQLICVGNRALLSQDPLFAAFIDHIARCGGMDMGGQDLCDGGIR